VDEDLLRAERHQALREGLGQLRPTYRELLVLLSTDPPPSYDQISERLGIPRGSIGPTRARALAELRTTAALRDLVGSGT
jgi:DNA-directed RNA polymerase specialized sigma24 family protein